MGAGQASRQDSHCPNWLDAHSCPERPEPLRPVAIGSVSPPATAGCPGCLRDVHAPAPRPDPEPLPARMHASRINDATAGLYLLLPACFTRRFHEIGPSSSVVS